MESIEQGKELAQNGDYAGALKIFKQAWETDPRNPDLLFFIGTCYSSLGEFSAAKYFYQESLKIDPDHSRTRMVWDGLDQVEARPPEDLQPARNGTEEGAAASADARPSDVGAGRLEDTTREPADPWAAAFPETMLDRPRRRSGLGIWFWLLIALAAAALVYFVVAPRFLP